MSNLSSDDRKNKKQEDKISVSGSGGKERVEIKRGKQEVTPITEYTRKVDLEPEVEGWLEKLEKEDTSLSQVVTDDTSDQKILEDAEEDRKKFKVILPLTKEEVDQGMHGKAIDSIRWLAEWCIKMIKMFHGKVAYRRK